MIDQQHSRKLTFLISITFVLGMISLVCLVFVIKAKNNQTPRVSQTTQQAQQKDQIQNSESLQEQPKVESTTELNLGSEVNEMDKLNVGAIESHYLDIELDK